MPLAAISCPWSGRQARSPAVPAIPRSCTHAAADPRAVAVNSIRGHSVTIRAATCADHDAIGDVLRQAYRDFGDPTLPYLQYVTDPSRWIDDAHWVRVAELDGRVVGVVAFALAGDGLHEATRPPMGDAGFRFLGVADDVRGRGIGSRLVDECVTAARQAGCHRIAIYTMEFMHAAHRMYERHGFDRRADLDVVFPGGRGLAYTFDLTDEATDRFGRPGPEPAELPWYEDVILR
jgi:GNAT superfamily N-acetyltransferase